LLEEVARLGGTLAIGGCIAWRRTLFAIGGCIAWRRALYIEEGIMSKRGTPFVGFGQEEGAPKRGGAHVQEFHQISQDFFKEGASTSGQRLYIEEGIVSKRGTPFVGFGQEEGAPKRGGAHVQELHQISQDFFKEGASTSEQRQRHLKAKENNKVKRLRV
jgi:hypothetical protein